MQYLQCGRLYISNVILKATHEVVQMRKYVMERLRMRESLTEVK